jgi:hypothetical protein
MIHFSELRSLLYEKNYTLGPDTVKVTCKGVLGLKITYDNKGNVTPDAKIKKSTEDLAKKNNVDIKWIQQNPEWIPTLIGNKQDIVKMIQTRYKGVAIGKVTNFDDYFKGGFKALFKLHPAPKR